MANIGPLIGGAVALYVISRLVRGDSSMEPAQPMPRPAQDVGPQDSKLVWPIDEKLITRVGESVMDHRAKSGRPHKGLDIFAEARTVVRAAQAGKVIRVIDGRKSNKESSQKAGLWIDIQGHDRFVYRYLHLGESYVEENRSVDRAMPIGYIAEAHASGSGESPHLHFEIRNGDYTRLRDDYGMPLDPQTKLPILRRNA